MSWQPELPVVRVRWARPTDKLDEVVTFYRDGLGLKELGHFEGHSGYDGVMLGLPGSDYHVEFTSHADGSPCPAPSIASSSRSRNLAAPTPAIRAIPPSPRANHSRKRLLRIG